MIIELGKGKMVKKGSNIFLYFNNVKEDITDAIIAKDDLEDFFENEKSPVPMLIVVKTNQDKNIEKITDVSLIYGTLSMALNIFKLNVRLLSETFWYEVWQVLHPQDI